VRRGVKANFDRLKELQVPCSLTKGGGNSEIPKGKGYSLLTINRMIRGVRGDFNHVLEGYKVGSHADGNKRWIT